MAGVYVCAKFSYASAESGDLPFQEGDILQILYDVDANWCCGKLYGRVGSFPKSYVEPIHLPDIQPGQKAFAAIKDFHSDVKGDLSFEKSDIVVGCRKLDRNWWHGTCKGQEGIFPITHVQELDIPAENSTANVTYSIASLDNGAISEQAPVIARGRANMDLTAQLHDELSLHCGDIVEITQVIDADFVIGRCGGRSGSFPLAFVDITEGFVSVKKEEKRHSKFDWFKHDEHIEVSGSNVAASEEKKQEKITQNNVVHDSVPSTSTTEFTANVPYSVTYEAQYDYSTYEPSHNTASYNSLNTSSLENGGITPYGKTLFPFVGENPNELTIFDNEIVTLLRHVDDQWIEGEIDGKRGIFPVSYVEIIVDCPHDYDRNSCKVLPPTAKSLKTFPQDTFGCVLYDFVAEESGDLNLREGDTIRLVSQLDSDWYRAITDDGQSGMCPVSYVEVIPAEPLTIGKSATKADSSTVNNNNTIKASDVKISSDKPAISVKPKPALAPKPQKKDVPTVSGACMGRSVSVDSSEGSNCTVKPVRPSLTPSRPVSISASLDDIIQKEITQRKQEHSSVEPPKPSLNALAQSSTNKQRHSYIDLESSSSSSSVTYHRSASLQSAPVIPPRVHQAKKPSPLKHAPPRPKFHPTPQSPVAESSVAGEFGPRPVPQRAAPPRPSGRPTVTPRRKRTDNLMDFSPDDKESPIFGQDQADENMDFIQDLERRIAEVQTDLQKCEQSKSAAEGQLSLATSELERDDLLENIEFYTANIAGLRNEIIDLTGVLYDMQPERAEAEQISLRKQEEQRISSDERRKLQEAMREKHRETRQKVINEIIQTEKDYLHSINLLFESFFHSDAFKCPGVDAETLLCNMDEVSELSQKLLTSLESATNGIPFEHQVIGRCFAEMRDDMKRVYAPYCRNHDDVIALLSKYGKDPEIQVCFSQMLDLMRQQASVFNLGAEFIKPVQRILKYPLLLNELVKSTEDEHPDKQDLVQAINAMTDVAASINEFKRRKDLVLKYKNTADVKFSEKMAKLNMHSTKKKLQRLSQKMVGIQTIDDNFIREERKFKNLDSTLRFLVRDVSVYAENVQDSCTAQETLASSISVYYGDQNTIQDVNQFCKVHREIASKIYNKFREEIEEFVITPLNRLLSMFQGPIKVIKKRHDKLLDYDNLSSKVKNLRDQEQLRNERVNLQSAKNDYEALNAQLLDELPKLHDLSLDVMHECIGYLALAQRDYYNSSLEQIYNMLGLQLVLGNETTNVIETFNIAHTTAVDKLSYIHFIPKTFDPRIEEKRASMRSRRSSEVKGSPRTAGSPRNECASQSDSQRAYLRQQYAPDRLYVVSQTVGGSQELDLDLAQGTMVGVVKEGDPMGNKEHWYVDTGVNKGFIMKHFLSPAKSALSTGLPPAEVSMAPVAGMAGKMSENLLDLISLLPPTPPASDNTATYEQEFDQYFEDAQDLASCQTSSVNSPLTNALSYPSHDLHDAGDTNMYQAVYSFAARNELEMDITEGETVYVLEYHDQDGNLEWWLIERDGKQGYAPATYLYKVQ